MTPRQVVTRFWELMNTNDFASVGAVLADDYTLEWPQSNERIRGRVNFARMNAEYPAHGRWTFDLNRIVAAENEVVTEVSVTDGVQATRVVSFFTIVDGRIARQVEFWADPFPAPATRAHLVEPIFPSPRPTK